MERVPWMARRGLYSSEKRMGERVCGITLC